MKIHREGKNILLILFIILALLNLPVYLWIKITWLAYLIHAVSIIFFFLVVNFFRPNTNTSPSRSRTRTCVWSASTYIWPQVRRPRSRLHSPRSRSDGDNELQNAPHGMTIRGHTSWLHHGGDGNPSSPFLYSFPKSSALPYSAQQSSFHPSSRQHILYAATRCPSRNHSDTFAIKDTNPTNRSFDIRFQIRTDRFL